MPLYVRQLNDGIQSGSEFPVGAHYDGQPAEELLARKRQSHLDNGWQIDQETVTFFHAWKDYPPGRPADAPARKDRYFEIRA